MSKKTKYEVLVFGVGVFNCKTLASARKKASIERLRAKRFFGGSKPAAKIFEEGKLIEWITQ